MKTAVSLVLSAVANSVTGVLLNTAHSRDLLQDYLQKQSIL